jgi:hypothetical protein
MAGSENRFEQVDESRDDSINLMLWRDDRGDVRAQVLAPTTITETINKSIDSGASERTILQSLARAVALHRRTGADIVVVDHDRCWQAEWGTLYRK